MQFVIAIILLIVAYAITALTSRGPTAPVSSRLSDFTTPQYAEGTPQAVIFGDVWIDDFTVLWFGNFSSVPIYSNAKK